MYDLKSMVVLRCYDTYEGSFGACLIDHFWNDKLHQHITTQMRALHSALAECRCHHDVNQGQRPS